MRTVVPRDDRARQRFGLAMSGVVSGGLQNGLPQKHGNDAVLFASRRDINDYK